MKLNTNENLKTVFYCYYSVDELITEEDLEEQAYIDYEAGCYSPKLLRTSELEIDTVVYEVADDMKKLELARGQVQTSGKVRVS